MAGSARPESSATAPEFFSGAWADAVGGALTAGPSERAREGRLQMYWDFFGLVKSGYPASWALGCRDLPGPPGDSAGQSGDGGGPRYLFVQWDGGRVTDCRIAGPDAPRASYVLGMDYAGWKALHEGYGAQRTVMYRKILLEQGELLEFFKAIYFFVECLAVIGAVPARYPALAAR
ncbi:MAG TPA: hypothetical protein VGM53_11620 [Streptosporangiaceae bacterium]